MSMAPLPLRCQDEDNLYPRNVYPADPPFLQRDPWPVCRYAVQVISEQIWVAV